MMSGTQPINHLERILKDTKSEKLAFAVTGLTVVLLAAMVLKECKGLMREERGRGR